MKLLAAAALLLLPLPDPDVHEHKAIEALSFGATALQPAVRLTRLQETEPLPPPPLEPGRRPVSVWRETALAAGWPANLWYFVACTMERESGGDPYAYNGRGADRSFGLLQMNVKGRLWTWFLDKGLTDPRQLFDPYTNLRMAWIMFQERDAQPWSYSCR